MTKKPRIDHADTFVHWWDLLTPDDLPNPKREYRFHQTRRWRFDLAWPSQLIAVEVEGGIYIGGRHVRGKGFEGDCEKYNAAVMLGWRVLRFTTGQLEADPSGCIDMICELIRKTEID